MADGGDSPVDAQRTQGWCIDPFGVHQHRWISQDRPSNLVRDNGIEAKDPPPDRPPSLPFVKVVADPMSMSSRDMLRADGDKDAVSPDLGDYGMAAMDANVVFDSGLVGVPEAEGALKGGRYGGRRKPTTIPTTASPPSKWTPVGFLLLALIGGLLIGVGASMKAPLDQVQGSVISASSSGDSQVWKLQVALTVPERGDFTFNVSTRESSTPDHPGLGAGAAVTVSYDPRNPAHAHLVPSGVWANISGGTESEGVVVLATGVVVLLAAGVWAARWWRRRTVTVASSRVVGR